MTHPPRLIAVGDNCLDVYLTKNHMAVGGNALNVAAQWARQGRAARYFGVVGGDAEGELICAALAGAGLDPADVERRPGSTAVTLLLERDGDRRFLLEDLGVGQGYVPDTPRRADMLAADWVHLGTNTAPDLLAFLAGQGARFSIDLSTRPEDLPLAGVPLAFASGPEAAGAPVAPLLQALRGRGAACAVVTCGSRGAFLDAGAGVVAMPARPVAVVDTCGAGDSFIASFIAAAVIEGRPAEEALRQATAAAAATCGHEGGFPQPLNPIPAWLFDKYADVIATAEH